MPWAIENALVSDVLFLILPIYIGIYLARTIPPETNWDFREFRLTEKMYGVFIPSSDSSLVLIINKFPLIIINLEELLTKNYFKHLQRLFVEPRYTNYFKNK